MKLTRLIYGFMAVMLLSSCSQFKSLTSRDNSSARNPSHKSSTKKVRFLDMAVRPGEVVTSRHDMNPSMPSYSRRKMQRDSYNANIRTSLNALDIERADFLQLKYAIVL